MARKQTRDYSVRIYFTEEEYQAFLELSRFRDTSESETGRRLVLDGMYGVTRTLPVSQQNSRSVAA